MFSQINEFNKYFKVEFTNIFYNFKETQEKINDWDNQVSQLNEYINELNILIVEKN